MSSELCAIALWVIYMINISHLKCHFKNEATIVTCSWWRHQIETFSTLLAICAGNSPVTGAFPTQKPVTRSLDVFFDFRMNGWVNNGEAGDLGRHRAHYDVIVMSIICHVFWTSETCCLFHHVLVDNVVPKIDVIVWKDMCMPTIYNDVFILKFSYCQIVVLWKIRYVVRNLWFYH